MLDQPLPACPITQERKVLTGNKSKIQCRSVFVISQCLSALQHGPPDEVTSEEEEEEEMGEVFLCIQWIHVHSLPVQFVPTSCF